MVLSGAAFNPGNYSFWNIVFICLFITILFYGIIYVYYEKSEKLPELKSIPYLRRLNYYRIFSSPFVFARFENVHNDGEYENIAVNLEHAPSIVDLAAESAFKNPISINSEATTSAYEKPKSINFSESVSFKKSQVRYDDDDYNKIEETPLEEINIETVE